jgi:hypothetical protein
MVGIKAKDIKNHTTKDHSMENTIKITIKTRPERNIISTIRKDISLQNIIPKTARLLINNTVNNLRI